MRKEKLIEVTQDEMAVTNEVQAQVLVTQLDLQRLHLRRYNFCNRNLRRAVQEQLEMILARILNNNYM